MNLRFLLVCLPLFATSLVVVAAAFRIPGDKSVHRSLQLTGGAVLLWQLSCMLEFAAAGGALFPRAHLLTMPLAAYAAFGYLLLSLRFYGLGEYLNRTSIVLILALPTVTLLLALLGDPFLLIYSELEVASLYPVYTLRLTPAAWYWAHLVYCSLLLLLALYFACIQHLLLPRSFRECSVLMIASLLLNSLSVTLSLLPILARGVVLTLIVVGTCCALVPLYVVIRNNDRMNYLYMARTHIMDQLDTSIFILDSEHHVLDANRAARQSLEAWIGTSEIDSLNKVEQYIRCLGAKFEPAIEGEQGTDVTISTDELNCVFNIREEPLPDKTGRMLGSAVVCTDVTRNRRLIQWLEQTSGTDPLTGLPNRSSLGLRWAEYESEAALPLTIIAGDVNGLKEINDTHGHLYGDKLLVAVGRSLAASIPPRGTVFRIGGDEFVTVLPQTDAQEAAAIQQQIQTALEGLEILSFRPSMALGSATRTTQTLDLEQIMHQADQAMYRAKKNGRS